MIWVTSQLMGLPYDSTISTGNAEFVAPWKSGRGDGNRHRFADRAKPLCLSRDLPLCSWGEGSAYDLAWNISSLMEISRWILRVSPLMGSMNPGGIGESWWIKTGGLMFCHFTSFSTQFQCFNPLYLKLEQPQLDLENGHFISALSSLGNVHGGWQAGIGIWNHVLGQMGCLKAKISL